jgi:hypothetical protein
MKRLVLAFLFLASLPALAQDFAGRSSSDVFVLPPYRLCVGEGDGQNVCLTKTGNQTAGFTGAFTAPNINGTVYVDGKTYPLTATGIQNALNTVAAGSLDGVGGTVYLPGGTIKLGSTGLSIPGGVTLACGARYACQLQYTGSGVAINMKSVFHVGLRDIYISLPAPVSGQTCIALTGTPSNQAQENLIEKNTCFFGNSRNGSITAGTVGITVTGQSGPADVALNRIIGNVIFQAATPLTTNNSEQNYFTEDRVEWYTAPGITFGSDSVANWATLRIAGSGTTGSAVSVAGTKNHIYAWCDSGAANCFNETGSLNYLEGVGFGGGITNQGTIATNGGSFAMWQGQPTSQVYAWSCFINSTIQNSSANDWCHFTSPVPITLVRLEGVVQGSSGAGCSTTPQLQFQSGASTQNLSFTNGQGSVDSGALSVNFNAAKNQINVVGGSGCSSGWAGGFAVSVQYQIQ